MNMTFIWIGINKYKKWITWFDCRWQAYQLLKCEKNSVVTQLKYMDIPMVL